MNSAFDQKMHSECTDWLGHGEENVRDVVDVNGKAVVPLASTVVAEPGGDEIQPKIQPSC